MHSSTYTLVNGNQAVAHIAYRVSEVCAIYPITPSSEMSELVSEWSTEGKENIFKSIPDVFEMQSEAGVAGAMHGAIQTGALSTTFTASQGLLLMMPNMYKIAGELTPNVIHVATRAIATHALSVFGDHSDVMAVRNTGYGMLAAASVQEAMDLALISHAATLKSRIPFVHFFDGFRTSHEISKVQAIPDHMINKMIDADAIYSHKKNALNPDRPFIRGTAQGPDVFFQSREAVNPFYNACPEIVQEQMDIFNTLSGRKYNIFDYTGHPEAEQVIITMASSCETVEKTINYLNKKGNRIGLIKVRLFRPFSMAHLIKQLPASCNAIAVLDRTKEAGSTGEPLYQDVSQAIMSAYNDNILLKLPKIIGGRYGLASKEFTPAMVCAIIENLKSDRPINNFTVGIKDDITHLSLPDTIAPDFVENCFEAKFYNIKNDTSHKNFTKLIASIGSADQYFTQGFEECNYKKSTSKHIAHLRISSNVIKAPYLIEKADFVAFDSIQFLKSENITKQIKKGGKLLINTALNSEEILKYLSKETQLFLKQNEISIYKIDLSLTKNEEYNIEYCFLALQPEFDNMNSRIGIKDSITKIDFPFEIETSEIYTNEISIFGETLLGKFIAGKGDDFPVSVMPVDGTYSSDTSKFELSGFGDYIPEWQPDLCVQCGACSMACPQASLRIKVYDDNYLENAPSSFKSIKSTEVDWELDLLNYTLQIHPDQCNSCNHCIDACDAGALLKREKRDNNLPETANWKYFEKIPEFDRTRININRLSQQQLQEPLFKYSSGNKGCGEAPYLKLLSQLFGDRLLTANATGESSIFGGALPTTPWAINHEGRGPAWSNSLFEDNAEFGLGYRLSIDYQKQNAKKMLVALKPYLDEELVEEILNCQQQNESSINQLRIKIAQLKVQLEFMNNNKSKSLLNCIDYLVDKSVWIVGGDGWAYDIGYGGLDHVMASGKNVNILVLDNEVYSNTGGQMSKSTPMGAHAKFAEYGKQKQKKDLGLLAMHYEDVYVASVAIGADQEQTLKAFIEAEKFNGPSLIIAYCHSNNHGIDMESPSKYHSAAVASGQWLLYRNNPDLLKQNKNTFQFDSPAQSIPIEEYLKMEQRFSGLFKNNFVSEQLLYFLQQKVNQRYEKFQRKSELNFIDA